MVAHVAVLASCFSGRTTVAVVGKVPVALVLLVEKDCFERMLTVPKQFGINCMHFVQVLSGIIHNLAGLVAARFNTIILVFVYV